MELVAQKVIKKLFDSSAKYRQFDHPSLRSVAQSDQCTVADIIVVDSKTK
jgi:hypothetical protein